MRMSEKCNNNNHTSDNSLISRRTNGDKKVCPPPIAKQFNPMHPVASHNTIMEPGMKRIHLICSPGINFFLSFIGNFRVDFCGAAGCVP